MSDSPETRLTMRGISKRFGPTIALDEVDLTLLPGQVHALIGENGAGKSTLMKILSGAQPPDAGDMTLNGKPYAPTGPLDAREAGIAMIYQELTLAPHLTVEENVMLGLEQTRCGFLKTKIMRRQTLAALAELDHPDIRPDVQVRQLSVGAQQLVEIARALVIDASVIVMDEPTSSLTQNDARHLFNLIRKLREQGVTIVYISHFLEEAKEVADRYTVLRDGETVGTGDMAGTSIDQIIEMMVGRQFDQMFPHSSHDRGDPVLELNDLAGADIPLQVDLTLHRGEILGLAGLIGAGRTETLRAVFGLDPIRRGTVTIATLTDRGNSPKARLAQGVGLLSENRKEEGLALNLSVADNTTLSRLGPFERFGFLNLRRQRAAVAELIDKVGIKTQGPDQSVEYLSGGNQQKVAIARLLHHDVDVLLLDEPTRGIDVASKVQIYELMGQLAAQGKAILFVSSYLPELLGICDRIGVMSRGCLLEIRPTSEWTEQSVMAVATAGTL
jgi:ribose transport system ATP-binding protein